MRYIAVVILVCLLVLPVWGSTPDQNAISLQEVLSGKVYPLAIQLSDMNDEWVRMGVEGTSHSPLPQVLWYYISAIQGMDIIPSFTYYTKGDLVTCTDQNYLVAYRTKAEPDTIEDMFTGEEPELKPLTPETELSLCLLSITTVDRMFDIKQFDLNAEIAESRRITGANEKELEARRNKSMSHLKQIGIALYMYTCDYDEVIPPMDDPDALKEALIPYVRNEQVFLQPDTDQPYAVNPILSGRKCGHISNPHEMVTVYEGLPDSEGGRMVLRLNGRVEHLEDYEWELAKRQSRIE